ncbi:ferritin-like domain-containing protein [Enterococcus hirae]|jgi:DNA-binding ferritin-like protein|nr:DNA starvation/stationary phase protection protein [Enterococcaceae bacterium]MDM8213970.1 ferritin-like domain-containing protein [Enterococcus hirae]
MSDYTEKKYKSELAKKEKEQQIPTVGAMAAHILANLRIHNLKLQQYIWFVKGPFRPALRTVFDQLREKTYQSFDELGELLLDNDQIVPTTTREFLNLSMLEENGAYKYAKAEDMVKDVIGDLATQNIFLDRTISLTDKENLNDVFVHFLIHLKADNQRAIRELQFFLGNSVYQGLDE